MTSRESAVPTRTCWSATPRTRTVPRPRGLEGIRKLGQSAFSPPSIFGAGGRRPAALIAGSLTPGSTADVVVVNQIDNVVALVAGQGNNNLDPPATSPTAGAKPVAVAAADFDRDGVLDVAIANAGSGNVAVCPGDGTSFACSPIKVMP